MGNKIFTKLCLIKFSIIHCDVKMAIWYPSSSGHYIHLPVMAFKVCYWVVLFHEIFAKKREIHVFLAALLTENSVLSWALTFILWRFSALPTSRYQSVRWFSFRGRSPAQFLEKAAFTSYIPKNQCMTIPLRLQNTAQMQL